MQMQMVSKPAESFLHDSYVDFQQKGWSRFKVDLPTSEDLD